MKTAIFWSRLYVGFSIFSLGMVSLLSMYSPQATMDLVQVTLGNNDAISSIRGIYGGVGIALVCSLCYLLYAHIGLALRFLAIFWGMYALSRLLTLFIDGPLGAFGTQWLVIESAQCLLAMFLLFRSKPVSVPAF